MWAWRYVIIEFYNSASITCDLNRRHKVTIFRQENRSLNLMVHGELNQVNCKKDIHHLLLESGSTIWELAAFGKPSQPDLEA